MKKAFTLIELLVTLTLGLIFLNFIFEYKLNFLNEIRTLKIENNLARDRYNFSYILTKGYVDNTLFIPGITMLNTFKDSQWYKTKWDGTNDAWMIFTNNNGFAQITYTRFEPWRFPKLRIYVYDKFIINSTLAIRQAETNDNLLYSIEYEATSNTDQNISFGSYKKLVYTK